MQNPAQTHSDAHGSNSSSMSETNNLIWTEPLGAVLRRCIQSMTEVELPTRLIDGAAHTPKEAISLWLRYQNLHFHDIRMTLSSMNGELIVLPHHATWVRQRPHQRIALCNTTIIVAMCVFIGAVRRFGWPHHSVQCMVLPPGMNIPYSRYLINTPVSHSNGPARLVLDSDFLDIELRPRDSLSRYKTAQKYLDLLAQADRYKQDVALLILDLFRQHPTKFDISDIAQAMNTSTKSITQHLSALGTNYKQLLEFHQKIELLNELQASNDRLQDIAGRLHYNSEYKMGLACRRWFHTSPESIRQHRGSSSDTFR